MARKLASVVFSLGCLHASSVYALGLGEIKLDSFLNQPLSASVDLLNTGSLHQDEIKVRLATREDFDKLGLDRAYFLTDIKFEVVMDHGGRAHIKMTSDQPVLEPYLDFLVEARWPSGRLLREYTVLIDPPSFVQSENVVSASERVETVEGIPAPAKKKSEAAASSGTKVNVRKSDLGPGEMPQRDFNAAAAGAPAPGTRYMISRDDTLWTIASRAQPDGASVYQTMLDIQRLNPNAFINGNINRVKAGYIIYLPTAEDISSGDTAAALAEVREQNAAWREQRDAELHASRGPTLKISAEPGIGEAPGTGGTAAAETTVAAPGVAAAAPSSEAAALADANTQNRLVALEQQLETLQRIVNLKDEQIAALQNAISESGSDGAGTGEIDAALDSDAMLEAASEAAEAMDDAVLDDTGMDDGASDAGLVDESTAAVEAVSEAAVVAAPEPAAAAEEAAKPKPKPKPKPVEPAPQGIDWLTYGLYALGGLLVAGLAFVFVRRRRQDADEDDFEAEDVFSEVELQEEELDVQQAADDSYDEPDLGTVLDDAGDDSAAARKAGYGEHRHDEYASEAEASDALAEADIYIAYGRHPQAIDLLNNALASEPDNPVYRLKLIEVYTELGDRGAAAAQLEQLHELGDTQASAQGEAIFNNAGGSDDGFDALADSDADPSAPGLKPNPLEMDETADDSLENEFSGLEIEEGDDEGELDLSADFDDDGDSDDDEEELVIAADANGLSTKMDLARAYIDMGDEEGAKQILEEVIAEGSDELRLEAETLLDRIGG